jgi:NitT/TauT family transport system substrate-binding protein
MLNKLVFALVLVIVMVTTGCAKSAPAERVTLKMGSLPRIFDMVLFTAQQEGVFEKNNIKVEIVPFRSVVERNTAFLAGQLDGFVDSFYEAININKGQEYCRVVGHNTMPDMFVIVASPSAGITNPQQLKGKEIGTSTGTIMEYGLDQLLASAGLTPQDVKPSNVPNMPLRLEMLMQGKLPAAIMTPPLSEQALAAGALRLLDDNKQQLAGPSLIFSLNAVNIKASGVRGFVTSWQQTVRLINKDPEKYRGLLVSTAAVPESLAGTYKVPIFPEMRLPTEVEGKTMTDWMKSKGMITVDIAYEKIVDISFIK